MKCLLTHLLGTQNTPINLSVVNWSFYLAPNQDLKNMYNYKKTEGDDRGWDGWIASPTQWTWVWVNSGSWWWTGRPGMLQSMGSQSQTQTEQLNWTKLTLKFSFLQRETYHGHYRMRFLKADVCQEWFSISYLTNERGIRKLYLCFSEHVWV